MKLFVFVSVGFFLCWFMFEPQSQVQMDMVTCWKINTDIVYESDT